MNKLEIVQKDCIDYLLNYQITNKEKCNLIYIDPPFNTGKTQNRVYTKVVDSKGNIVQYTDNNVNYSKWLRCCAYHARENLIPNGSFFLHLDWRESHAAKLMLDDVFGKENFQNEIIWSYDFGGRSKKRWPRKHDSIFWYTKNPDNYTFNYEEIDRIPYMAPGLCGPEKAAKGKTLTDVWWNTIVPTNGKEKTGYPTQKPLKILERIVKVHSNEGDLCMDFCAGSGSFGEVCLKNNRRVILVDNNFQAIEIMQKRLAKYV